MTSYTCGRKEYRYVKDIYKSLIKDLMNERIDKIVVRRKKFRKADKRYNKALKRCDDLPLSKEDAKVVDHAIDALAAQSAIYAELAYEQGIKDAVWMLKKIEVI